MRPTSAKATGAHLSNESLRRPAYPLANEVAPRPLRSLRRACAVMVPLVVGVASWGVAGWAVVRGETDAWAQKRTAGGGTAGGRAVATHLAFSGMDSNSAELTVELSRTVDVDEVRDGAVLRLLLRGAKTAARNDRNPLILTHFDAPVTDARLRDVAGGAELRVTLRAPTTVASYAVRPVAGGRAQLVVALGDAKGPTAPPAAAKGDAGSPEP